MPHSVWHIMASMDHEILKKNSTIYDIAKSLGISVRHAYRLYPPKQQPRPSPQELLSLPVSTLQLKYPHLKRTRLYQLKKLARTPPA